MTSENNVVVADLLDAELASRLGDSLLGGWITTGRVYKDPNQVDFIFKYCSLNESAALIMTLLRSDTGGALRPYFDFTLAELYARQFVEELSFVDNLVLDTGHALIDLLKVVDLTVKARREEKEFEYPEQVELVAANIISELTTPESYWVNSLRVTPTTAGGGQLLQGIKFNLLHCITPKLVDQQILIGRIHKFCSTGEGGEELKEDLQPLYQLLENIQAYDFLRQAAVSRWSPHARYGAMFIIPVNVPVDMLKNFTMEQFKLFWNLQESNPGDAQAHLALVAAM